MKNLQESIRNDIDKLSEAPVELDKKVTYKIEMEWEANVTYEYKVNGGEMMKQLGQSTEPEKIIKYSMKMVNPPIKDIDPRNPTEYKVTRYVNGTIDEVIVDE